MSLTAAFAELLLETDDDTVLIPGAQARDILLELEALDRSRKIHAELTADERGPTGEDYCLLINAIGREPAPGQDVEHSVLKGRADNAAAEAPTNAAKQLSADAHRTVLKDYEDKYEQASRTPNLRWAALHPTDQQRLVLNTLEIVLGFDPQPFIEGGNGALMFYWGDVLYEVKEDGTLI